MGRPRKRPRQDAGLSRRDSAVAVSSIAADATVAPAIDSAAAAASEIDMEGLHFLADQASTPGSFFNLLGLGDIDFDMDLAQISTPPESDASLADLQPPSFKGISDILSPMGVPALGLGLVDDGSRCDGMMTTMTPATTESTATPSSISLLDVPPDVPPDSCGFDDAAARPSGMLDAPSRRCGCLARLYLALDALQTLPGDVVSALQVARNAAHAAHDTIQCGNCALVAPGMGDVPFTTPPIQSMQSLMLLGALLPSIAHAYRQILALVDAEAARATAARQRLPLSLQAYGGVWGWLSGWDDSTWPGGGRYGVRKGGGHSKGHARGIAEGQLADIPSLETGENRLLDPHLWRLVVRALLKSDVYGIHVDRDMPIYGGYKNNSNRAKWGTSGTSAAPCTTGGSSPLQLGLRDIVELMAAQAQARHSSMDAAVAAGLVPNAEARGYVPLPPGEKHNCQTIIEIARREIDKLVIA